MLVFVDVKSESLHFNDVSERDVFFLFDLEVSFLLKRARVAIFEAHEALMEIDRAVCTEVLFLEFARRLWQLP